MTTNIHQRVLEVIGQYAMIHPGDRVGISVSGGADSVAMLRIFADLRVTLGISLLVLHFHHQLRGAEADEDERFVKALAVELHLDVESGRADVAAEAKRRGWNLEDAARRLRYQFFASVAATRGLNRVAVAHTADDQAETVLSHVLRGTGVTGLAGIYPVAGLIVRPLLELRREDLRDFLSELGQPWREDATNRDTSRVRARIRHRLIPLLQRDFDSAAVLRLSRLAAHAREDEAFWRFLEEDRFNALVTRESPAAISLSIESLLSPFPLPESPMRQVRSGAALHSAPTLSLTRRLVRRIFCELRGSREQLTSRHVESILDLATKSQSGAKIELPGVCVERIFDWVCFTRILPVPDASSGSEGNHPNREFAYAVPSIERTKHVSIAVPEIHRRFNLKVVDWPLGPSETVVGGGVLDFDRVRWPLVLRNWRPGDSYRPHGSLRVRKIKRLLLQSRIPRRAREGWPVLTGADQVIWASGFPVAEWLVPQRETRIGLVIGEDEF